jgi:glycosyltransferase involved in cell wall biosynthesis
MNKEVMVSICCVTYNHEKFIRDAIEGFLMQKTTSPIEIIIHDDASTDNTADIVREYEKKYPELIKPIYQKENQYSKRINSPLNFVWQKCSGKYIATCEGDDYWTDPYKLQKQIDFLETNEDFIVTFTNCQEIDKEGNVLKNNIVEERDDRTYTHFDMPIHAPNLTRLFRNKYLNNIPKSFFNVPGEDTYLLVWQSKFGKIKYQNFNSANYRVISQGVWSGQSDFQKHHHLFQTRYAILEIAERKLKKKLVFLLSKILIDMARAARGNEENLLCKNLHSKLLIYCKNERRNHGFTLLDCLKFHVSLVLKYYIYLYFYIKTKDKIPQFIKIAIKKLYCRIQIK